MAQRVQLKVGAGKTILVSNLEKVLYPAAGFTKGHLIDYYTKVAALILPHLAGRPITLKRYPDGIHGEAFWEKDAPEFKPDWVKTAAVARKLEPGEIDYILINDVATLAWCASIATIELHPFLHRAANLEQPTSVVFDLDPGEGADILRSAEVGLWLRDVLTGLGLKGFPKVSGSKGVQVHVPLNTPVNYESTKAFSRAVAQLLAREHPELVVAEMSKALRADRVFVDWSQNIQTKTTVGVYSLRAKRGRPYVSMPVRWEELAAALKGEDAAKLYFEAEAALKRLKRVGDLYAPVLTLKQKLPKEFLREAPRASTATRRKTKALETYAAKRDFTRTPEPAPVPRRSQQGGKRRFAIQKHAASHLHYDLRLEINETLKSWALPKGVPFSLDESRTAVQTEDHPIEYLQFEGTIPERQYGGGTVMVWDIGTFEIVEGNYWKGRLHVHFSGKKLKGEWWLERQSETSRERTVWSMTKVGKSMKAVSARRDDASALTGRTMNEIREARDAEWQSNRVSAPAKREAPRKTKLPPAPRFVPPMLATKKDKLPSGENWLYEIKWDGYRVLAIKHGKSVRLWSRKGNDITSQFPEVAAAVADLDVDVAAIDGEVVAVDEKLRVSFEQLQNRAKLPKGWHIVLCAFDLLSINGNDVTAEPLVERKRRLGEILKGSGTVFSVDLAMPATKALAYARKQGHEGVVAKRRDSTYDVSGKGRRSGAWVKVQTKPKQEFVIGGFRPGHGNFQLLLVGYYDDGKLIYAGKVRNALNATIREDVFRRLKPLRTNKCPFANLPNSSTDHFGESVTADEMDDYCWVRPRVVAEVKFTSWTRGVVLRHAEFAGLREDKDAREVVRE